MSSRKLGKITDTENIWKYTKRTGKNRGKNIGRNLRKTGWKHGGNEGGEEMIVCKSLGRTQTCPHRYHPLPMRSSGQADHEIQRDAAALISFQSKSWGLFQVSNDVEQCRRYEIPKIKAVDWPRKSIKLEKQSECSNKKISEQTSHHSDDHSVTPVYFSVSAFRKQNRGRKNVSGEFQSQFPRLSPRSLSM